jgi:DNA-binding winged helix-turn-helix (wHTH) protein
MATSATPFSSGKPAWSSASRDEAKVTFSGEYIRHHLKEEEQEMFPDVRKTGLELKALGEQLAARKAELEQQMKVQVQ